VAGAADIGAAVLLEGLIGAYPLAAYVVILPAGRADPLAKLVIEAFRGDIPLSSAIHSFGPKCGSMINLRACVPSFAGGFR
jgi:hypothetical protein